MKKMIKTNQTFSFLRNFTGISFLFAALIILSSCGNGQRSARQMQEQRLNEVKQETVESINSIKNDIEERIEYIDEEIEKASGEAEEELKQNREELKKQLLKLEAKMERVEKATVEEWEDVLTAATKTVQEARQKTNEISEKVREMLDEVTD